jgi:hypothetical protein
MLLSHGIAENAFQQESILISLGFLPVKKGYFKYYNQHN